MTVYEYRPQDKEAEVQGSAIGLPYKTAGIHTWI